MPDIADEAVIIAHETEAAACRSTDTPVVNARHVRVRMQDERQADGSVADGIVEWAMLTGLDRDSKLRAKYLRRRWQREQAHCK